MIVFVAFAISINRIGTLFLQRADKLSQVSSNSSLNTFCAFRLYGSTRRIRPSYTWQIYAAAFVIRNFTFIAPTRGSFSNTRSQDRVRVNKFPLRHTDQRSRSTNSTNSALFGNIERQNRPSIKGSFYWMKCLQLHNRHSHAIPECNREGWKILSPIIRQKKFCLSSKSTHSYDYGKLRTRCREFVISYTPPLAASRAQIIVSFNNNV